MSLATPAFADKKPKPDKAKTLKIAQDASDFELRHGFFVDCDLELPKGYKFVEPSKAVWVDKNATFWSVAWTGVTSEGYGYEITMLVDKDNSGTYVTDHKKVICKKKS